MSDAFTEDPVRLLRVARFAATLPDFTVHKSTQMLLCDIVTAGELQHLTTERVWQEFHKALSQKATWRFFDVLIESGAQHFLWPMFKDSNGYTLLQRSVEASTKPESRFASLFFGKTQTELDAFVTRYKPPKLFVELAKMVVSHARGCYTNIQHQSAHAWVDRFECLDVWRRPERFSAYCEVLSWLYPNADWHLFQAAASKLADIQYAALANKETLSGDALKHALNIARVNALNVYFENGLY